MNPIPMSRLRSSVPLSSDTLRGRLCALGAHLQDLVANARGVDMAAVTGSTAADVIYGIDRVADDALLGWFEKHWRERPGG